MTISFALECGAEEVVSALISAGVAADRVSGWGMYRLEPQVDVDGIDYANVTSANVAAILAGRNRNANLTLTADHAETMKFGSFCALGNFTPYPVKSAITHWPEDCGPTK